MDLRSEGAQIPKSVCSFVFALLFAEGLLFGQTPAAPQWYYVLENLSNKTVVQRGTTTIAGFPVNALILAPNTRYRQWILNGTTAEVGFRDFVSSDPGLRTTIPPIPLGPPHTPDLDGDGLSGEAEFILGTDPRKADTDGDGINDRNAARLGLRTGGIPLGVATVVDTPGQAVDLCAFNDLLAVADLGEGVSVYNVFNGMNPILVGRSGTPGQAKRVSFSGPWLAVGVGEAGLCILSVTNPAELAVRHRLTSEALGGEVVALATSGDLAYVGTATGLSVVDLPRGVILRSDFGFGPIDDLTEVEDTLYMLTPTHLRTFSSFDRGLTNRGEIYLSGEPVPLDNRRKLVVAEGTAYLGYFRGYSVVSVADPFKPRLIALPEGTQFAMHDLDLTGSGRLLATTSFAGEETLAASIYDVTNPRVVTNLVSSFDTPGTARASAIYNGIGYVADSLAGLTVLNYQATDRLGKAPSVSLRTTLETNTVVETRSVVLVARVADDVQPRNVEFYVDGVKVATDGSYPFEVRVATPRRAERTQSVVRARASDTGGNEAWSEELILKLLPDTEAPFVSKTTPENGETWLRVDRVRIEFNEALVPPSLGKDFAKVLSAGPDGLFDSVDDVPIPFSSVAYSDLDRSINVQFPGWLQAGQYRVELGVLKDLVGNATTGTIQIHFAVAKFEEDPSNAIAAARNNSAALKQDGSIWAWGELDTSPFTGASDVARHPRLVANGRRWVSVKSGGRFWLAISDDGSLWGWGDNTRTELGDSSIRTGGKTPIRLMPEQRWIHAVGNSYDSVAIDTDRKLWAWGANFNGQRGDGTFDLFKPPTRVKVPAEKRWKTASVGNGCAVAITEEGELWGWGRMDVLGGRNPTPTPIHRDRKWKQVAANPYLLYAIAEDGTLWGGLDYSVGGWPRQIGKERKWRQISSQGLDHLIGIAEDGTLWEWGKEVRHKEHSGVLSGVWSEPPRQVGTNANWAAVADGMTHTLALTREGILWAWGEDAYGELGNGMKTSVTTPTKIAAVGRRFGSVVCGSLHTAAVDDRGVGWFWGSNQYHEMGLPVPLASSEPIELNGFNWSRLFLGEAHSFGIAPDGGVFAWGNNLAGQLGNGDSGPYAEIKEPTPIRMATRTRLESAGGFSALAIAVDGTLWGWGSNSQGQLATTEQSLPEPHQIDSAATWKMVSTSGSHSLGVKEDDSLWSWGSNYYGELGNGSASFEGTPEMHLIPLDGPFRSISAGPGHSMAVDDAGRLWGWGSNYHGELGVGDWNFSFEPMQVGTDTDWIQVSAGGDFSAGIKADRTLWVWGWNRRGELGIGTFEEKTEPVQIGFGLEWDSVNAGAAHCAARTVGGEIYVWGANDFGQVGNGAAVLVPLEVLGGPVWGPKP